MVKAGIFMVPGVSQHGREGRAAPHRVAALKAEIDERIE